MHISLRAQKLAQTLHVLQQLDTALTALVPAGCLAFRHYSTFKPLFSLPEFTGKKYLLKPNNLIFTKKFSSGFKKSDC